MNLHHSIDALGIRPGTVFAAGFTAQDRVDPAISVGRHVIDDRLDLIHQFLIGERRPPPGSGRTLPHTFRYVGSGDTQGLAHRRHREPSFGNESERNRCFFDPDA